MKHEERISKSADREAAIKMINSALSGLSKELISGMLAVVIYENKRPDLGIDEICESFKKVEGEKSE